MQQGHLGSHEAGGLGPGQDTEPDDTVRLQQEPRPGTGVLGILAQKAV